MLGSSWPHSLYVAAGRDPFALVEHAVAGAARLSGGAKPRTQKLVPSSLDSFGWCTWDAFYSRVSARGVGSACETSCLPEPPAAAAVSARSHRN